jgi:methylphosphotriester-DNA--protein-cysteine methyltransferase
MKYGIEIIRRLGEPWPGLSAGRHLWLAIFGPHCPERIGSVRNPLVASNLCADSFVLMDPDECYARLSRRDATADGEFFVAVRTTGIYCRPICPARLPLRRNVTFYRTAAEAQVEGYRPCLRCRPESAPDSPAWVGTLASVRRALRLIDEGALVEHSVEDLADQLGVSERHLRRLFQTHVGASPIAVEQARRVHLAKKLLHETAMPVTEIAFAAGYGSIRRMNEVFAGLFGRPPSAWRRRRVPHDPAAPLHITLARGVGVGDRNVASGRIMLPRTARGFAEWRAVDDCQVSVGLFNVSIAEIAVAIANVKAHLRR